MKEGRKEGNGVLGHEEDVLLERGNRTEIIRDVTCHPDISDHIPFNAWILDGYVQMLVLVRLTNFGLLYVMSVI